jgi:hypothetical protein
MLTLPEELLLLAIQDEKGSLVTSSSFAINYGIAGAILLELAFEDYIEYKEKRIVVRKRAYKENSVFNEALKHIKELPKEKNARYWISRLTAKIKKLRKRILDQLVDKKILYKNERKVLWIFTSTTYPIKDSTPKSEIKTKIREAILHGKKHDDRTIALIALVNACGFINQIFTKGERKLAKIKIEEIMKKNVIAKAVIDTVTAMRVIIASGVTTMFLLSIG